MSNVAARASAHKHGLKLLRSGDYSEAVSTLEQTVQLHGSHVGLRSDLAFAAYLSGDMGSFRRFVAGLELEFQQARPLLAEKSRIFTHVSLSKFLEELGRVSEALEHIEAALKLLSPGHEQELTVKAQKLRVLASFGREDEVALLYRDCLTVSERRPNQFFECFHALLIAEARLLGFTAALARIHELAKRKDLFPSALRLCAMDLLEIAIETKNDTGAAEILRLLPILPGDAPDPFERELLRIAADAPPASDEDFLRFTRIVSPMGQLRLLGLESRRNGGNASGARVRLALLFESFDHRSRQFLHRKWHKSFLCDEPHELLAIEAELTVKCGEKELQFSQRAQHWDLLRAFEHTDALPPAELLAKLGKRDSESEQEGLRISLLRLNRKLAPLAGTDWVFRFGKQSVQRNPMVRIKNA